MIMPMPGLLLTWQNSERSTSKGRPNMNMSKYPTLIRDIPTEQPMEPRTAAQDMAAGETFYSNEWLSPEKLRAIRKTQEDAATAERGSRVTGAAGGGPT
jgi:hypothetical protein